MWAGLSWSLSDCGGREVTRVPTANRAIVALAHGRFWHEADLPRCSHNGRYRVEKQTWPGWDKIDANDPTRTCVAPTDRPTPHTAGRDLLCSKPHGVVLTLLVAT